jgi:regulator of sigma E protease
MRDLYTVLTYVVGIGGMFLLLIAPHEGGHFLFAKLFKVRVIEFSIGAGTKLWSATRGGTVYALRAVPILGYVRMGGMEEGDFDEPNGFHSKAAWQRILILVAGPAANFVFAMLIITAYGLTNLNSDPGRIATVIQNSPAAGVGFQAGDSIQTVNGKTVTSPNQMRAAEDAAPGAALVVGGVHSDGRRFDYVVVPNCTNGVCRVGVVPSLVLTWQGAVSDGVSFPFVIVRQSVQGLWSLVDGQVPGGLLGNQGLNGPIGIADVAQQAVAAGPTTYLVVVALLSVALGFTNLLPLLALDGGRIVVVLIEWLRRRPFDRAMELNFQRWGLVALLGLVVVLSILDIQRIATGQFPGLH